MEQRECDRYLLFENYSKRMILRFLAEPLKYCLTIFPNANLAAFLIEVSFGVFNLRLNQLHYA